MNYFDNGDPKILFSHLPKTGGKSVLYYLDKLFKNPRNNVKSSLRGHIAAKEYVRQGIIDSTFTIITGARNPWDWHVSFYYFQKNWNQYNYKQQFTDLFNQISFSDYLYKIINNDLELLNPTNEEICPLNMWWYKDINNENIIIDHIIKTETLSEDFSKISTQYDFIQFDDIHLNKSIRMPSYNEYYTTDTRNLVKKLHEEYIDYFEYTF